MSEYFTHHRGPSNKDNRHRKRKLISMEENWLNSEETDGNSTKSTRRTYIVHGHSSEEGEWEISIEDLILQSERHGRKAREIAEAIGIEVMGNP